MTTRIKVTSRRLPKIVSTSPKLPRIEGDDLAEALGAERIGTVGDTSTSREGQARADILTTVKERD